MASGLTATAERNFSCDGKNSWLYDFLHPKFIQHAEDIYAICYNPIDTNKRQLSYFLFVFFSLLLQQLANDTNKMIYATCLFSPTGTIKMT